MNKTVQYFSKDYLESCKKLSPDQVLEFLENFSALVSNKKQKRQLISLKVEPSLLKAFKQKASLEGIPYQKKIKSLMRDWINKKTI